MKPQKKPLSKGKSHHRGNFSRPSGGKSRSRHGGGSKGRRMNNSIMGRPKKPPLIASEKTDGKLLINRLILHH